METLPSAHPAAASFRLAPDSELPFSFGTVQWAALGGTVIVTVAALDLPPELDAVNVKLSVPEKLAFGV